jgi:DNA-binding SARP family transcriptional activator
LEKFQWKPLQHFHAVWNMTMQGKFSNSHRIYTFGSLQIKNENTAVLLKREKTRSLLSYLILRPNILHRREMLADKLWPQAPAERVRKNLSDVLYHLQKEVKAQWLVIDSNCVMLQQDPDLWVDVWEFDDLIAGKTPEKLEKAVRLYTDDLLPEIYEEWMVPERELRRSQFLSAMELLSDQYTAQGDLQQALLFVRKLILTEPLHEPAHQSYLRLLGRLKRFGEAISHYDYLCALLRAELDAQPTAMTAAILESLLNERDLEHTHVLIEETRPFIGRKPERAAAFAMVEAMLTGNGGLLTVEGEAGIGKSRLLREIASGVRWRGATVLQGQASEIPVSSPFLPIIEALAPLLNSPVYAKQLEALMADETLALLTAINPQWRSKGIPPGVQSEQAGKHFQHALHLLGEVLAQLKPMAIVLDDLHWGTTALWECLASFGSGFSAKGGLLILAYRRPEIEKLSGWKVIQTWDQDGLLNTISLKPFNLDEVKQFIGNLKDVHPTWLYERTAGNPFFLNQYLAEPELTQLSQEGTISFRLQALSINVRRALESASIIGESIPYRLWTEIVGLSPLELATITDELIIHQWLQSSRTGYSFTHDLIRTAVYDSIEPKHRRHLHERTARALSTLDPDNLRARAFHLDRAGLIAEAASAYRLAGEQDLARLAFREAQDALDHALTLQPNTPTVERISTALALARACDATGDRVRQEAAIQEALSCSTNNPTYRLEALLAGAKFATLTGRLAEAESQLADALSLAQELQDDAREIEAIILFGNLSAEQSKWSEAHQWSLRALKHAQTTGNRSAEGRALRFIGIVTRTMGHPEKSIPWLEKAIVVHHTLGDCFQVSVAQTNLLGSFSEVGSWDRLITTAQEVVTRRDGLGDRVGASIARHNQSLAYLAIGDYITARQIIERVIKDSEAAQMRRRAGLARNVLGLIAEGEGNYDDALELYRASLEDAEALKAVTEMAYVQHDLGALFVRLDQPMDALPYLQAAQDAWSAQGNLQLCVKNEAYLGLAYLMAGDEARAAELAANNWSCFQTGVPVGEQTQDWLWTLHRLLKAVDQWESANTVLQAAYSELQRQAQNISDVKMRHDFFTKVQLNADIVKAHDQMNQVSRLISISLARMDIPLGRSLREEEFVTVQWTLSAPEDDVISDKVERRRHRLKRLLGEARLQNGCPTDDDLAHALSVSRRTILRDMDQLAQEIPKASTRKRK